MYYKNECTRKIYAFKFFFIKAQIADTEIEKEIIKILIRLVF